MTTVNLSKGWSFVEALAIPLQDWDGTDTIYGAKWLPNDTRNLLSKIVVLGKRTEYVNPIDQFLDLQSHFPEYHIFARDPVGWWQHGTFIRFGQHGHRFRGPSDVPPGVGFTFLKETGAYIKPLDYYTRTLVVEPSIMMAKTSYVNSQGQKAIPIFFYGDTLDFHWIPEGYDEVARVARLHEQAVGKFYSRMRKRTKIQGLVMLGELRETLGLLSKLLTSLADLLLACKRGDRDAMFRIVARYSTERAPNRIKSKAEVKRQAKRANSTFDPTDFSSNLWLEFQFGWKPIVSDIQALLDWLKDIRQKNSGKFLYFSVAGRGTERIEKVRLTGYNGYNPFSEYDAYVTGTFERDYTIRAVYRVDDPLDVLLGSLGMNNLYSGAWNLLTLSFVIDWIIPVGDWIENNIATSGLTLVDSMTSSRVTITAESSSLLHPSASETVPGVKIKRESFTRLVDFEPKQPEVPVLAFDFLRSISTWTGTTLVALIRQLSK